MKKELIAKLTVLALVATIGSTTLSPGLKVKAIEQSSIEMVNIGANNSIRDTVKQFVSVNKDGLIELSVKTPKIIYSEYKLEDLNKHFDYLNNQVKDGSIIINSDLSIVNLKQEIRAGKNYEKTHWWGLEIGYSYSTALNEITKLQNVAIGAGTVAGIGGSLGNVLVGVVGGVTAGYCGMMANSLKNRNDNNNKRGVVIDVNWTSIYKVYSQ